MHGSIFGCLLYHKETKEHQMGFHMYFNCWCIAVWQLKDLIAVKSVSLASFNIASFSPLCSTACKCNGHASVCNTNTGKCFCTTKGIKGDECQLWVCFTLLFEIKRPCTYRYGTPTFFNTCIYDVSAHLFLLTVDWLHWRCSQPCFPWGITGTKWFPEDFHF